MRPIKFRGLHPDPTKNSSYFVYGFPTQDLPNSTAYYNKCSYRIHWHHENGGTANAPIINGTLSQFTGLLDRNGEEIYEGDVVIGDYTEKDVKKGHIVKYETIYHEMGVAIGYDGLNKGVEIIGNIYENPELLSN